jgi:ribosomal protein S18 acetylase RimI-like enzyme
MDAVAHVTVKSLFLAGSESMEIRRYTRQDEVLLLALIRSEREEWSDYFDANGMNPRYQAALQNSFVYVAAQEAMICGFVRARDDDGLGIYIYDLLVHKDFRGNGYGHLLMEHVRREFPGNTVYVMSDVDGYYSKLSYRRVGSIFELGNSPF